MRVYATLLCTATPPSHVMPRHATPPPQCECALGSPSLCAWVVGARGARRVGVEFSLGSYEKREDKVTVGVRGSLDKGFVPHAFAQSYVNGTGNRRTQVRVHF